MAFSIAGTNKLPIDYWNIKPELTSSYARQSVVFPPSSDSGLSIQLLGRTPTS
jgi:hypothetical protein